MSGLSNQRIIIMFGSLEMGGAERQGLLLARYLKEQAGASVQVWGLGKTVGPVAEQCDQWQIPWRKVPLHWGLRRRLLHLVRLGFLLRDQKPDILISYTTVPNLAVALLWRISGARLSVWNQSDAGLLLGKGWFHRFAVGRVRCFISNAEEGIHFLKRAFGVSDHQLRLIRNGVWLPAPAAAPMAWRQRLGMADGQLLVVMVANLSCYKDHKTLVDAWKLLSEAWDGVLPLLALAGRFDDQTAALQHQVATLGMSDQIRFLGAVDDISGLLATADLAVHSSISEGIPNAVLEAMSAGLAVVASDIPGLREAVGEEGAGFMFPPGNAVVLARQLKTLLEDKEIRVDLGQKLACRADQQFGVERMCRETVACLEECL